MKIHKYSIKFLLLIVIAASYTLSVRAQAKEEDKTLSPYFLVQGDPKVDHLPLKNTNVDISITGIIADVRVVQTYRNEGSRPIHATYLFPASTRAAVYSMRMRIGNQVIVAKIKEREAAKKDFEKAKEEGKSASLLEENRPNVFSMKLANVMPQDEIEIELRYTELLVPTSGIYEVVYPTVVGPRYASKEDSQPQQKVNGPYLHEGEAPTSSLSISTRISTGVPIEDLSCLSHQIVPEWQDKTVAKFRLDDADPFQGNRDFVVRYRLKGKEIQSGLILYEGTDENFFLFMAQPPQRVVQEELPPREYIFVVDVSGSMEGFPLDTSKKLLEDLIGQLRPTDKFNVILFAGDSSLLSEVSLVASKQNVSKALYLLQEQRGSGGTELLPAIQQAMSIPQDAGFSRSIVLVTDGYISGEEGVFDYIRQNLDKSNIFAFGIGSSVNRYLIEGVARAGMGEPFIVTEPAEAAVMADRLREYIQYPILTDIRVQARDFEVYDVFPKQFPDLLADRPIVVYGKWRGPLGGTFELTGASGSGQYSASFDVASVAPDEGNAALRYLWARSRIAELSDYGSSNIKDDRVREITDLGLKYNLLTPYTSFIAVREEVINPDGSATEVDQPLPLPIGVSDLAVGSEPELIWLLFGLAVAVVTLAFRRFRGRPLGLSLRS